MNLLSAVGEVNVMECRSSYHCCGVKRHVTFYKVEVKGRSKPVLCVCVSEPSGHLYYRRPNALQYAKHLVCWAPATPWPRMSTLNSNPSPNKSTGTKRPYEVTTPSNLGTPRDTTSALNGRSPGPSKKSRPNGEKELSRGGQWMIAKLDELQRMYKVSKMR
jgi:hypothetical protein